MCTVLVDCCRTKISFEHAAGWSTVHRQHWGRKRTIVGYATTRGQKLSPYELPTKDTTGKEFTGSVYCHYLCKALDDKIRTKDIHQLLYVVGTEVFKCVQSKNDTDMDKKRKYEIPVYTSAINGVTDEDTDVFYGIS